MFRSQTNHSGQKTDDHANDLKSNEYACAGVTECSEQIEKVLATTIIIIIIINAFATAVFHTMKITYTQWHVNVKIIHGDDCIQERETRGKSQYANYSVSGLRVIAFLRPTHREAPEVT